MAKKRKPKTDRMKIEGEPDAAPPPAQPPMMPEGEPEEDPEEKRKRKEQEEAARSRADEIRDEKTLEKVRELMKKVSQGFQDQWDRGNDQLDYWDVYDCVLGGHQGYAGNSQIFIPIVHDAVEARETRFINQIFPRSGRNVECISSDEKPYGVMALLEHYIRKTKLRTQVMPSLMRNGDVEGQYNIYMGWDTSSRHVVYRQKPTVEVEGEEVEDEADDDEDIVEEEIKTALPTVEVLADADVLVLPHTANSVGQALQKGGSATILRRWSKERLQQAIDDEEVDEEEGEMLLKEMGNSKDAPDAPNADKKHVDAAGINAKAGGSELTLYEVWTYFKLDGVRRLCRIYYAGVANDDGGAGGGKERDRILSVRRCPYWTDRCPLLSAPVHKLSNAFKGKSLISNVAPLQYAANDTINEGQDSATYALMPIVMTDPAKNPRVGSMVLNLAAIWETNPNDTKFAQFPQLWKDAIQIVAYYQTQIFQSLSVSPAIIPQSSGGKAKRNQAEIANEQQVDLISTADVCTNLEDEILTQILRWFVDLDYQFRESAITVRQYGQMGLRAKMEEIPPLQIDKRYEFRWFGVEAARNAQMQQQQIATVNVVRGIPPQMYPGYELNVVPVLSQLIENTFGPRLAPEIFRDMKSKLSIDAEEENEFLMEGITLPVHELDDDREHMQRHLQAMKEGDPSGSVRQHMLYHRMQMNKKLAMQQQSLAGMQGAPGGAAPGIAGTPRPGATPAPPRGGQNPPGAIHQDRMQDASRAPRR